MDFERMASEHKDAVYRQLLRMTHNREDAEDILIEALVKAFRCQHELRNPEQFQAWLVQIARRIYHKMRHKRALHPMLGLDTLPSDLPELQSSFAAPDEAAMAEELEGHLRKALDSLPPMYREVYSLHDLHEFHAKEVGRRLGLTLAAVKSRLHRAREMIRQRLDPVVHGTGSSTHEHHIIEKTSDLDA